MSEESHVVHALTGLLLDTGHSKLNRFRAGINGIPPVKSGYRNVAAIEWTVGRSEPPTIRRAESPVLAGFPSINPLRTTERPRSPVSRQRAPSSRVRRRISTDAVAGASEIPVRTRGGRDTLHEWLSPAEICARNLDEFVRNGAHCSGGVAAGLRHCIAHQNLT